MDDKRELVLKYASVTIRTDDGTTIEILRDESVRPSNSFYFAAQQFAAIRRRMRELGAEKLDFKLVRRLVREGHVQAWEGI